MNDAIDRKVYAILDRCAAIDWRQPIHDPSGIRAAYRRWQAAIGLDLPIRIATDPAEAGIWTLSDEGSDLAVAEGELPTSAARPDSWIARFWLDMLNGRIPLQPTIDALYPEASNGSKVALPPALPVDWNVATAWASFLFMGQIAQEGAEKWIEASAERIAGAPETLSAMNLFLPFSFYGPWGPPSCVAMGLRNALAASSAAACWDALVQTSVSQSNVAQKLRELGIQAGALYLSQRDEIIDAFIRLCEPMLAACENGAFVHIVTGSELIVVASPSIWTDGRRLHRADGPAVAWQKTKVHAWKGVFVPERVLLQPHTMTVDTIRGVADPLLQGALFDIYARLHGHRRSMQNLGGVMAHEDATGRLWCANLAQPQAPQAGDIKLVEVLNGTPEPDGSRKLYWLRVPPWMQTAQEAVAWTYGMTLEEYGGLVVRT